MQNSKSAVVAVLLALVSAAPVAAQSNDPWVNRIGVVCVGDAHTQPHLWIGEGDVINYSDLGCGAEKRINVHAEILNDSYPGLTAQFALNGRYAATEGAAPWRMFGDRGAKNDGSYVWSIGTWSVGVWAMAPADVALSSRTWSFTVVDRPGTVVDVEGALLDALAVILPSHPESDNRDLLQAVRNVSSGDAVRRLLIDAILDACATCQ